MNRNILCISNHGDMLGGGEHSFLNLLGHLPAPWCPVAVVPSEGELGRLLEKCNIQTHIIQLNAIRPWSVPKMLKTIKRIVSLCRKKDPALLYANGSRAAFYAGVSKPFHRRPVVWHCRIAESDLFMDLLLEHLSNLIVTNSQATANRFGQRAHSKVRVVYNGVHIDWFRDDSVRKPGLIDEEWKVILVVARISRWKRHDLVLSAFERIAGLEPKVHLVCLGSRDPLEPEWRNYLQERSHHSPFSNRIHWVGHVEDVRPWYRAAYMLVLASENEPFGRVLVEAMACGLPVIATKNGGVPEIVRHGKEGFLVLPGNSEEIAEAMLKILKDQPLRESLGRFAEKRAEYFSLDSHVEKMIKVFDEVITG